MTPTTNKPPVLLAVENEHLILMDLADLLMDAGYRVIAEMNGEHALAVLTARSDIDLLFTDIYLPGPLNGSALARIVDRRWPLIALIATSGYGQPAPGELPDAVHFLPKPYTPSALLQAVQGALPAGAQAAALADKSLA